MFTSPDVLEKEIQAAYGFIIQLYFVFIIVGNALAVGAVSGHSRLLLLITRVI